MFALATLAKESRDPLLSRDPWQTPRPIRPMFALATFAKESRDPLLGHDPWQTPRPIRPMTNAATHSTHVCSSDPRQRKPRPTFGNPWHRPILSSRQIICFDLKITLQYRLFKTANCKQERKALHFVFFNMAKHTPEPQSNSAPHTWRQCPCLSALIPYAYSCIPNNRKCSFEIPWVNFGLFVRILDQ